MANFLIDLFKKAPKGDSYRAPETPQKYNDNIAILNSTNQNAPSTSKIQVAQHTVSQDLGSTRRPSA